MDGEMLEPLQPCESHYCIRRNLTRQRAQIECRLCQTIFRLPMHKGCQNDFPTVPLCHMCRTDDSQLDVRSEYSMGTVGEDGIIRSLEADTRLDLYNMITEIMAIMEPKNGSR